MQAKLLWTLIATVCFGSVNVGTTDACAMDTEENAREERLITLRHSLSSCRVPVQFYDNGYTKTAECKNMNINSNQRAYKCENCKLTMNLIENLQKVKQKVKQ